MPVAKKNDPTTQPATTTAATARKPWTPKSPIDVILDQIKRQEDRVAKLQAELDSEKTTLNKLNQAKAIFEAS
jgi:hypothetical protein